VCGLTPRRRKDQTPWRPSSHTHTHVWQYLQGPTTSITAHQNAQFKRRTSKSHKPLVYAGNLNVNVKGELAKQVVVAASREASSVPARALAAAIVR
jgi:hypothetical protein